MSLKDVTGALKSLKLSLKQSFLLKQQCNLLKQVVEILDQDVKGDVAWYSQRESLRFTLSTFLKQFLRYARINLRVTEATANGLGELRKGRSLCNVNKLRLKLNEYSSELQMLVFASELNERIGSSIVQVLGGDKLSQAYSADNLSIVSLFDQVFGDLERIFPDIPEISQVNNVLISKWQQGNVSYTDFENPLLLKVSYKLEQRLLGMTAQEATPFQRLQMGTVFRTGKFGEILTGTLGGPLQICIQKVPSEKLQTLSSAGRIKLFSTVRANVAKSHHENLVKVIGTTFHENTLYISLEKVNFSLADFLHGSGTVGPTKLSPGDLLYTFHSVASALQYLQKDAIIHGDLRPENIFFSRLATKGSVKLALFSYELNLEELHWSTWNDEGLAYQAPEVLGKKDFSPASDVYALGITLWESVQQDKLPFFDVPKETLVEEIKSGARPEFSGSTQEAAWLVSLARKCWSSKPWVRPSISDFIEELEEVAMELGKEVSELKSFIAPMVKDREKKVSKAGGAAAASINNSMEITSPRPLPPIAQQQTPKSTPRPLPPVARPTPPQPVREVPKLPDRDAPNLPVRPSPSPSPRREIPVLPDRPIPPVMNESADTLNRVEREMSSELDNPPQPEATGVNGLTANEVRQELVRFYTENDPDMLNELSQLVNWCMVNGLEQFERLLIERFGKGLPMFNGEQDSEGDEDEELEEDSGDKGGLASFFTRGGKRKGGGRAMPDLPPRPPGL